ncbi:uncharacterized protein LY79DRAFT_572398 [Colletotrichum navitas]|uniref:Uncharacterized protein n=1 Tax=Colletotrichum navitas TaxID=681940 RepID=A0AAD8PK23_9PEZI|nr:uncharacterized protein LY79DRAFT_572398 [Colletotrichum navitas]KAK1566251.1 hypothetical protein LY79DRAFT_572398 [Colletotrichum navitas]
MVLGKAAAARSSPTLFRPLNSLPISLMKGINNPKNSKPEDEPLTIPVTEAQKPGDWNEEIATGSFISTLYSNTPRPLAVVPKQSLQRRAPHTSST